MLKFIRSHQKSFVLVVSILVIIAFVWLYNNTDFERLGQGKVGTIYGRTITVPEYQREGRLFNLAADLGLERYLRELTFGAVSMNDAADRFAINSMVLRYNADKLGIYPSDDEVKMALMQMPVFLTNNAYDSSKYALFTTQYLTPRGFSDQQLIALMRDSIRFDRLRRLVGGPAIATPSIVKEAFDLRNTPMTVSVVRFPLADFLAGILIDDAEAQKFFDENNEHLRTEEKRKVRFAKFAMSDEIAAMEGKEKVAAQQKLADSSAQFAQSMLDKGTDFNGLATAAGAVTGETDWFTKTAPPADLSTEPRVATLAFSLSTQDPNSDPIDVGTGYLVLQLAEVDAPRAMTFEEAKPQIVEGLKRERAMAALEEKAAAARTAISASIEAGKTWDEAVTAAELKAETLPPFTRMTPNFEVQDSREIATASFNLGTKVLSEFVPTATGGLILMVTERPPIDETKLVEETPMLTAMITNQSQGALFREWLRVAREASSFSRTTVQ